MSSPAVAPVQISHKTAVPASRDGIAHLSVFLGSLLAVWLLVGNLFVFTSDEGIYFEGGRALLEGQVLYKDHFAFTGPGTYWFLAICFKLFGYTVAAGRIPFLVSIAITTTFVYWAVARYVSRSAGAFAALLCFAIETATPSMQ